MSGYSSSFTRLNVPYKYSADNTGNINTLNQFTKKVDNFGDSGILSLWEFSGGGVQIKEADVGQSCRECSKCIEGYEPHKWRKTCKRCKCSRNGHEIIAEHGARSRLGFVATHDGLDARSLGYTFVPPGLTSARQVDQYYSTLPSEEVPKLGSRGETNRSQKLVRQIPKQDLALSACKFVEPENQASYEDFISGRNQVALDVGIAKPTPPNSTCAHCNSPIHSQQISVVAPRLGDLVWHPSCFKCHTCGDILVDLAYCVHDGELFCVRHYSEEMKPRCAACDEGAPQRGDLTVISERYIQELRSIRNRIAKDLRQYQDTPPALCLNNHEDIEIEFSGGLQNSRSPSPRRFLVTEKSDLEKNANSTRKFLVSEEHEGGLKKSKSYDSIPEFLIQQEQNFEKSLHKPRYVLKEKPNDSSSSPIPRQFIVSEESLNTVVFEDVDFEVPETSYSRDKSLSPFLTVEAPQAPRNSICNDLEVQIEEPPLKFIPPLIAKKIDVILDTKNYNTTEYWTNKVLVVPSKLSRSNSGFRARDNKKDDNNIEDNNNIEDLIKYDEKYLNNLDGVSKSKDIKSFASSRKSFKKKNADKKPNTQNALDTPTVLKHAAEELEKVAIGEESPQASTSKVLDSKPGEPFWIIFSGEYIKAMSKDWHTQHFCCWQCDESLTGQRYVLRDEHPYCVSCYESVFANACEKCSRVIGIDSKDLSYKDKHWHEACFLCTTCGESLVDKQFGSKGDRIYCGNCYDQQFASRCDGCHAIFRAGTKKMEYKTRQWHEKCFCCCVCKVPIGTQSFIPREQEIYCAKCYEEKFATRCIKCNKVITSGGVTYKNEPWHRECFSCTHCQRSLAGERFTSRDEKPYCADCFGELFAKRCTACSKPITGIGGTKFISFEDRHWHNDCFFCASCRSSLVGRGFITDEDDIICPECAKAKLM